MNERTTNKRTNEQVKRPLAYLFVVRSFVCSFVHFVFQTLVQPPTEIHPAPRARCQQWSKFPSGSEEMNERTTNKRTNEQVKTVFRLTCSLFVRSFVRSFI
jgi:hypothetical protein